MEFIAFIVTVLVGFVAESLLGNWLNWPGVGAVSPLRSGGVILTGAAHKKRLPKHKAMPNSPGGCPGGQGKMIFGAGRQRNA